MDLGVHIGTDMNKSYNQYYNSYLLTIYKLREFNFLSLHNTNKNILKMSNKKMFFSTIKLPLISTTFSIFCLKKALYFIEGLGSSDGKLMFYHSDLKTQLGLHYFLRRSFTRFNHSFNYKKWMFGSGSNFYRCLFSLIDILIEYNEKKQDKQLRFIALFLRGLRMNIKVNSSSVIKNIAKNVDVDNFNYMNYWKAIIFMRYFHSYYVLPDVLIGVGPNSLGAIKEYSDLNIPSVSTVDTNHSFKLISYPIPSNAYSIPASLFFFNLFLNAYEYGRIKKFKSIKKIKDYNINSLSEQYIN